MKIKTTENGFTLIELLLAMTILSVLVVIVFEGFHIGVRAWEKGDVQVDAVQRQRIILDLFKRQVASALKMDQPGTFQGSGRLFRGDEGLFQFLSSVSVYRNDAFEKLLVQYRITGDEKGEQIHIRERDASMIDLSDMTDMEQDSEYRLLIEGADEIKIEYLDLMAGKDMQKWLTKWDIAKIKKYPDAVRLSVRHPAVGYEYRVVGRLICN